MEFKKLAADSFISQAAVRPSSTSLVCLSASCSYLEIRAVIHSVDQASSSQTAHLAFQVASHTAALASSCWAASC